MVQSQQEQLVNRQVITGNEAVARAVCQARAQVIAVYPITPQTTIIEEISSLVAKGKLNAKIMHVESEHSAMAACISAAFTGARTFTATSAQGLALMHELLHWAGGGRLPIVLANVNRAMAPGWSIWSDQNDSLSQRDTGWMQFYCESAQEVFDTIIQGFKIAETVSLPCMVVLDAFVLSHTAEPVDITDREIVDQFLPAYKPAFKLDPEKPSSFGALLRPAYYQQVRMKLQEAMTDTIDVARKVDREWGRITGRQWGLVETYRCKDADILLVTSATVTSTARVVIDELRKSGRKCGLIKIRMFRPFPTEEVRSALSKAKKVAIFDRNISYGHHGIFAQEIKSAMYHHRPAPMFRCYVGGLGGKDVTPQIIERVIIQTFESDSKGEDLIWI